MNHLLAKSVAACALLAAATAQDLVAIKGGRLVTLQGPVVEDGTVLIQNGRIAAVGPSAEVEVPWEAKVVDAAGKWVLPTWVLAHSQGGVRGANERMENVPFVQIADALDPSSDWFEHCRRNGVGTVHAIPGNNTLLGGAGIVVRPFGRTVQDMAVKTETGQKLSLQSQGGGRLLQIRKLRRALEEAKEYLADFERRKAEFEKEKAAGAIAADKEWTEEIDRTRKPVLDLLQKKARGWLYVPGAAEVPEALRLNQELDLVLVLGPRIHDAIDDLKQLGAPVVLDDTLEYFDTDRETQEERKVEIAGALAQAGVPFALSLAGGGPGASPWWQLATCVRQGVDRRTALEALTVVPARMLGLADQLGTLEVGKLGNVQVLTGDPLQATTWVDTVVLEGQVVYERANDPRLLHLFDGALPAGEGN
ncbi:MAG: amidohydrolase family protein [Planctomycetota bacterium]